MSSREVLSVLGEAVNRRSVLKKLGMAAVATRPLRWRNSNP